MSKWTNIWPKKPGLYFFYGYPVNKGVDTFPRLYTVVVEYVSEIFGVVYRTGRTTLKKSSGAYGMWKIIEVPDLPPLNEDKASDTSKNIKQIKNEEVSFE